MAAAALEARSLTLSWDGERRVVEDLSFSLAHGERLGLVGRSGTGKTTLLHALAGLSRPLSGAVLVDGQDVSGEPGHVSYMFQKDLLLPSKTILDNVVLPLTLGGVPRDEACAKAEPLLARFGLEGTQSLWPRELSGGMRQRAAFLRTYLMGSSVMLLDEPFSALDAITRTELRAWFARTADELGLSVLIVTHDVDEAVSMADRILVLDGEPRQGRPSRLAGEVVVGRPEQAAEGFELSPAYVDAKRALLELL